MKKRGLGLFLGAAAAGLAALTVAGCEKSYTADNSGEIFHIYAWNDEFKGFFEKYLSDEKLQFQKAADEKNESLKPAKTHLSGKEVKWTIVPSKDSAYQKALDEALLGNAKAPDSEKIDLFLAEADYILKYADTNYTRAVNKIGVTDFSNIYNYTKEAASDSKGVAKGVSFQCCPAGVIYRRSIAKKVLGVDTPEEVQKKISDWTKFNSVAKDMHDQGYLMTASFAETYRAFSNNVQKPWVDANGNLQFDSQIEDWMKQAETFVNNEYTLTAGVWDDACTAEMFADGRAFCYFGPAWYYNFSMGNAQDPDRGCYGDWGLVEGPAKYFWGGTWLLAAEGGNNDDLVAKTMNAFINDYDVCYKLVEKEGQFSNNQKANAAYAATGQGNAFLGGQNDTALYLELAKGIKFQNITIYDQQCNEGLQAKYQEYLTGVVTKDKAMANFKDYLKVYCPEIKLN